MLDIAIVVFVGCYLRMLVKVRWPLYMVVGGTQRCSSLQFCCCGVVARSLPHSVTFQHQHLGIEHTGMLTMRPEVRSIG